MTTQHTMSATIALGLLLAFSPTLWADRNDEKDDRKPVQREQQKEKRIVTEMERSREQAKEARQPQRVEPGRGSRVEVPPGQQRREVARDTPRNTYIVDKIRPPAPPKPGYVYDTRHRHNHYYPPQGHVETKAPVVSRIIKYRNESYHYHNGVWYRPYGSRFIVVLPPAGILVPVLPSYYTTVWFGTVPYYYAGGVYYNWQPEYRSYAVAEPPPEQQVRENLNGGGSDSLFIYPKQGQSDQQQAKDRYECHRWASDQTGFDPTEQGGSVPEAQHASKRADYHRAMKACLEARGYSVQ